MDSFSVAGVRQHSAWRGEAVCVIAEQNFLSQQLLIQLVFWAGWFLCCIREGEDGNLAWLKF